MTQQLARPDLARIALPGVELTYTSLRVTDADLTYDSWAAILAASGGLHSAAKFWIGDAINFGESVFGESYAQAAEALGIPVDTLGNWAYVCRKVSASRRRESLRFSHHYEVASLEPAEQVEWLEAAEANGWSVRELRDRVKESKPPPTQQSLPEWSDDQPPSREPLSPEQVEEASGRAEKTLERKLPTGHPLWENEAKALARDVIAVAATARRTLQEAVESLIDQAEVDGDYFRIPKAALLDVAALVGNND